MSSKYDPRIGSFSHGIKPDNVHYPCPICGEVNCTVKYQDGGKITVCKCGYETEGLFEAVTEPWLCEGCGGSFEMPTDTVTLEMIDDRLLCDQCK